MTSASLGPARRLPAGIALLILIALFAIPARLAAQGGTARVSYRTRDVVFVSAGRDEGVGVGDTLTLVREDGAALTSAVVISAARHTSSARLFDPDAAVREGTLVSFVPRAPETAAAADSMPAPPDYGVAEADTVEAYPEGAPARVWRRGVSGGLHVEEYASSSAVSSTLRTQQTVAALDLDAPLSGSVTVLLRGTARWRSGGSLALVSTPAFTTIPYQAELRIAPAGGRWSASLGRFVPPGAMGLGYLDGARVDVTIARGQRIGFVGGFVPQAQRLEFSADTRRAGAYWAFSGTSIDGSLSAATDWGAGTRRRAEVGAQTTWRPASGMYVYGYTEVDLPVTGGVTTTQVTTLSAGINASLPLGLRGGLNAQSYQPLPLWNPAQPVDTTPLPGRITGGGASLGRTFGHVAVDLTGGAFSRQGDPTPTLRGTGTISTGALFLTGTYQHSDLLDYSSAMVRLLIPTGTLPITFSIGGMAGITRTAGGTLTYKRYAFRPEFSWRLGRSLFATAGGDIGQYAGNTSTWLHAGVTYRFH